MGEHPTTGDVDATANDNNTNTAMKEITTPPAPLNSRAYRQSIEQMAAEIEERAETRWDEHDLIIKMARSTDWATDPEKAVVTTVQSETEPDRMMMNSQESLVPPFNSIETCAEAYDVVKQDLRDELGIWQTADSEEVAE